MLIKRLLSTTNARFTKIKPTNLKNKSVSSQHWITRQLADPYVERAKRLNYRCRSAFKLIEINEKCNFLQPGSIVVDCGASPGSWTQVAVNKVNADASQVDQPVGKVISIDKQQIYPINGAIILGNMDFTKPESQTKLFECLEGQKVDAVISDMAPSATGVRDLDNEIIIQLCYAALRFAVQISKPDLGSLVVKLWQCGQSKQLENDILKFYRTLKIIKPRASRSDSTELFYLAREFRGLKNKAHD